MVGRATTARCHVRIVSGILGPGRATVPPWPPVLELGASVAARRCHRDIVGAGRWPRTGEVLVGTVRGGRIETRVLVEVTGGLVQLVRQRLSPDRHLIGLGKIIDRNRRPTVGGDAFVGNGRHDASHHINAGLGGIGAVYRNNRRLSVMARVARQGRGGRVVVGRQISALIARVPLVSLVPGSGKEGRGLPARRGPGFVVRRHGGGGRSRGVKQQQPRLFDGGAKSRQAAAVGFLRLIAEPVRSERRQSMRGSLDRPARDRGGRGVQSCRQWTLCLRPQIDRIMSLFGGRGPNAAIRRVRGAVLCMNRELLA
jgi:hypothetical protein